MSDIDEIKSRLNIVDVISSRITLKKAGRNFKGLCPFHNEKSPSFMVSPDRQMWHCFGCGKGGSVIDFVMAYDHLEFIEALEDLADLAGVQLDRKSYATPADKQKQQIYEVNHLASEYYHYLLTKHGIGADARDYLKHRGVSDKSIDTFVLGYSPNSWDGLSKYLEKKGYQNDLLEKAGLVINSTKSRNVYDRFRGRVMFTLKDHRGNVVGFAGRVMQPNVKDAKYINTSETPVYIKSNVLYGLDVTKGNIQKANEAIIMEGELDVISSFQAGVNNVVAIKGSALTEGHARLLRRFTEKLVIALDSDLAGDAAARRGVEIAENLGFEMKVAHFVGGKDPDEIARENPAMLKKSIKEAVPVYDYFFSSAAKRFDIATAFGKKKIGEELLPVLMKIENPIVQNHYVKKLAKSLDVTEETIESSMKQHKSRNENKFLPKSEIPLPTRIRGEKLELYVLALILQGKTIDWMSELMETFKLSDLTIDSVSQIFEKLNDFLNGKKLFLLKDFADGLSSELLPTMDEANLLDVSEFIEDDNKSYHEWDVALKELRRDIIKRKIKSLGKLLSESDNESPIEVSNDLNALTTELKLLEKGD